MELCRNRIFATSNKIQQDIQICHYVVPYPPKRRRPKKAIPTKKHSIAVEYIIPNLRGGGFKRVCQAFFVSFTRLSKSRIRNVASTLKCGGVPHETRGGDQVSHKLQPSKEEVRTFLKQLKGQESHYGRRKSKRIYLSSNLSISKLYKEYKKASQDVLCPKVSFSTFHRIFSNEFNIGFKSPATDVCSLCERLKNSIIRETDASKKSKLMLEKRVHTIKANTFYELMKQNVPNAKTYCFDMQQVQPLPKSAVGDAFYLRQLGYYTLCIVETDTKSPVFYTWTEDQAGRGCTEVSSALIDFLNKNDSFGADTTHLRLFCDGCGGQNKNAYTIHSLIYWLQKSNTNIDTITIIFPVRGHSFLPVDRVFGRVEKALRKEPFIKTKECYHDLYKQVGNVRVLGEDWLLYNIKGLETIFKKLPGISAMKRVVLKRFSEKGRTVVKCRCLTNYRFESEIECFQNLGKRGCSINSYTLDKFPLVRSLPPKKTDDLKKLLVAVYNNNWEKDPELAWYVQILNRNENAVASTTTEDDDHEECDCLIEETPALHI